MNTEHKIKVYDSIYICDENVQLSEMRSYCPGFFRTKFGKRETYEVYRGCVICRHTVQFTGEKPQRRTIAYLYNKEEKDFFMVGQPGEVFRNAVEARRAIDDMILTGYLRG